MLDLVAKNVQKVVKVAQILLTANTVKMDC